MEDSTSQTPNRAADGRRTGYQQRRSSPRSAAVWDSSLPDLIPEPVTKAEPLQMEDYAAQALAGAWMDCEVTHAGDYERVAHCVMDALGLFPVLERGILEGSIAGHLEPPL